MYDLIIIGGGMSGISVGYFFRDWNVLLLEKEALFSGATGSNAGFLITGFGEHFHRTAQRWGVERATQIQQIHLASHRKIRELSNNVETCGSFSIGLTEKEAVELRQSYELMKANGFRVEWVDHAPCGLRNERAGLFNADDGFLDSQEFWKDLANAFPYQTNQEVLQVIEEGLSLRVTTVSQDFQARRVIYCLNAFSESLLPELKGTIIPVRGQMMEMQILNPPPCTQPIIAEYGEIYWNFTTGSLRFGGLEYVVPDEETGIATSLSDRILAAQLQWIQNNFDLLPAAAPLKTWYGTMGFTVDGFPLVGRVPGKRNQYLLAGLCGLGHSYALVCASWLHDLIANDKVEFPHYFSSDRILNLPRYTGGNWRTLYEAWNH